MASKNWRQAKAEQQRAEAENAALAHALHDDEHAPVAGCGFCQIAVQDREHRAYLAATPNAWEHHHGR